MLGFCTSLRSAASAAFVMSTAALAVAPPEAVSAQSLPLPAATDTWEHGFTRITSVRELPDGRLLVADQEENRVHLIDMASGESSFVGREGRGPGEYTRVGRLLPVDRTRTLLTDVNNRWYLLQGVELRQTMTQARPGNSLFGASLLGADGEGRVLGLQAVRSHPEDQYGMASTAESVAVVMASGVLDPDATEVRLDTVAEVKGAGWGAMCVRAAGAGRAGSQIGGCNPLAGGDRARLFPDGWIAIAYLDPYRVDWRRPDGTWVRGEPLQANPIGLDRAQECAALRRWSFRGVRSCSDAELDAIGWPGELPPFLSSPENPMAGRGTTTLLPDLAGNLIIRRTPTADLMNRYDVVDRSGSLLGTLILPPNEAFVGFGEGTAYSIRIDDLDLQWLRRHPWPPAGGG